MPEENPVLKEKRLEIQELRERLAEAEGAPGAMGRMEVDAPVVSGPEGVELRPLGGSEHRNSALVETMNEGAVNLSPNGTAVFSNSRFAEIVRMPVEEIVGSPFVRFLPSSQHPRFESFLEQSRKNGAKAEFTLRAADGTAVPMQLSAWALGVPPAGGFCVVITDLTEQKRAEREHSYLSAIVESSEDAIIGKSPDGTIQSWNRAAERLYGYKASEMIGQPFFLLVPPELKNTLARNLNAAQQGAGGERWETERVTKDGRRIVVAMTISPLRNANGQVVGASTIARDITEHKRVEEARSQSEEKYRSLISNIPDVIWTLDAELNFVFISPNIERMSGYPRKRLSAWMREAILLPASGRRSQGERRPPCAVCRRPAL